MGLRVSRRWGRARIAYTWHGPLHGAQDPDPVPVPAVGVDDPCRQRPVRAQRRHVRRRERAAPGVLATWTSRDSVGSRTAAGTRCLGRAAGKRDQRRGIASGNAGQARRSRRPARPP